jgi:periplasmic copper chaperone A
MTKRTTVLAVTAALLTPAAAEAHVTLQPDTAPAGGFTRLDVRVPNERDDQGTTKVAVQFPSGFEHASYEPVPGWDIEVARKGDFVDTITFTAASAKDAIAPGQFRDFGLSVGVPEGKPGDALTFKAVQTYAGGEVVRWIGPADADEPAPQVTLTEAGGEGSAAHGKGDAAAAPAAASDDDGGTLAIVALAIGVLGLLAGAAGLVVARRSPRGAVAR